MTEVTGVRQIIYKGKNVSLDKEENKDETVRVYKNARQIL